MCAFLFYRLLKWLDAMNYIPMIVYPMGLDMMIFLVLYETHIKPLLK